MEQWFSSISNSKNLEETTIEERKEILIITLLYEFCKSKKCKNSFEIFCYKLYESGYISNKIYASNPCSFKNELSLLSNLYKDDSELNIITLLDNTEKSLKNISTLSRFRSQFNETVLLGSGGFGNVYKVKNLIDECKYAIKVLNMDNLIQESFLILREVRILSKLKHPNIVGYYSSWMGVDDLDIEENGSFLKLYIQMELCDKNLNDYINERSNIEESKNLTFVKQISNGLKYIHQNNIIHRDIKPKNIFIKNDFQIKIGDFGLSRTIIDGNTKALIPQNELVYTSNLGCLIYSAPEQLNSNNYTFDVDIYSLGIIIFELFNLFRTEMEKIKEISEFKEKEDYESKWFKLSKLCTKIIPSDRIRLSRLDLFLE